MKPSSHPFITHVLFWFTLSFALIAWPTAWSEESSHDVKVAPVPVGIKACQSGESWSLGDLENSLSPRFISMIHSFLEKKLTTVRGFSEALAMRRQAKTPEEKFFSEYWISRSLYGSKMIHVAREGFALLAAREITPQTAGIQLAAVECLVQIHTVYPSISIPENIEARIPDYLDAARPLARTEVVWDLAMHAAIEKMSQKAVSKSDAEKITRSLDGSGPHADLVLGLLAAQNNDHSGAIQHLRSFLDTPGLPNKLQRYVTTAHIMLARSYYSVEQYDHAIENFKKVDRKSNELADSLQELTWAYLMSEQYKEAIGTAITLQAGGLRKTFTPEAPMVMAMAMNEICQYPESIKAATNFKKSYAPIYGWLDHWKKTSEKDNLYKLAIQYLKHEGDVPDRIAGEWIRSPVFISDQDEINLLFDEKVAATSMTSWGAKEQKSLTHELLKKIADVKPEFKKELALREKQGKPFSSSLQSDLASIRDTLNSFRNLQRSAPVWRSVLKHHLQLTPVIEHRLMAEINANLKHRSEIMHDQLEDIAENIDLIEVEIYNGASQDIIWQNAHPDFKKIAKEMGDDSDNRTPASQVWNWGKASDITEEGAEIWEDELGSFKANLPDNCSREDRYLALKTRRNSL